MKTMANQGLVYDIKPRIADSAYVEAPFDEGKKMLEEAGYRIISAEENARLRIQEGKEADISKNGNWTREGFVYVPNEAYVYLTKASPIMENPSEATQAHKAGKEFYPLIEQIQRAIENSVKIPYTQKPIPTDRFGENDITLFAFGQNAQVYGDFLRNGEPQINEISVYLVDKSNVKEKAFARQLWLGFLDYRSDLSGNYGSLNCLNRVRGVPSQAAEGSAAAQKNLSCINSTEEIKLYANEDISRALNGLNLSGLESII